MGVHATLPAIAGAGQSIQRPGDWSDPREARGPIELMVDAARAAGSDAGVPALLERAGWVGVAGGNWDYLNPGQLIASELGCAGAATVLTAISGTAPQDLVRIAADHIARGDLDVALIVGGEAHWSTQQLRRRGVEPSWITATGEGAPEPHGAFPETQKAERSLFGGAPQAYALIEDRLRRSLGHTVDEHRAHISALWARFSAVAAGNPFAWDRFAHSSEQICAATSDNRMIAFPYTKAHVANNTVDLASAILMCSVEVARSMGVESDRLVFPHAATSSHDTWTVVERDELHESPGLTAGGHAAFELAGIGPDDVEHLDLYACFPSIVQMSAQALGFASRDRLTLTGGLGFAGAAIANSSGHAIAALVPEVRSGGWGFVHANGGHATKHAFGVYANTPPTQFRSLDCEARLRLNPRGVAAADAIGHVEAATVAYERSGPSHVIAAVRTADGRRALRLSHDKELVAQVLADGIVGTSL